MSTPTLWGAFGESVLRDFSAPTDKSNKRNENYDAALALAKSDALNQKLNNESKRKANKRIETL